MNQDEALKLGTVYACVRLIADSISTLPMETFRRDGQRVYSRALSGSTRPRLACHARRISRRY
jgi:phage portal protein BeeE